MNSINSVLSPPGYDWGVPSIPDSVPEQSADPSGSSTRLPYESLHAPSTNNVQIPSGFQGVDDAMATQEQAVSKQQNPPTLSDSTLSKAPRRSRRGNLDFEIHKEELKRLYLIEDKSLNDVMALMNQKYSFPESTKRYKDMFDVWGWRKNLPVEHAQWMVQKAHKRRREDGKETVFLYGGLRWDKADAEKSVTRSKKPRTESGSIVVETPNEIEYQTPANHVTSPQNAASITRNSGKGKQRAQTESESEDDGNDLPLNWRGHSREQLSAIFEAARSHAENGSDRAEALFLTAAEGYGHLLGPTHDETVKVSFAMASFYTKQGQSTDADKVLEDVCRCHISKYGRKDRRTIQLILQIVELLNGWNRGLDALTFLTRSKDLLQSEKASSATSKRTKTRRRSKTPEARKTSNELLDIAQDIVTSKSTAVVDYGIDVARTHVAANDEAVEAFLQAIIQHCNNDLEGLEIQNLKARSELLKLYNKTNRNLEQQASFLAGVDAATVAIWGKVWDKKCFKSFEVMEALLELSASVLKGSFEDEAWRLFEQIEQKAEDEFGWDSERTIWAKINIGIIYERTKSWEYAQPWFNHAYAASIAANGDEDGISRSLQTALEKRHFAYISDEGRPFKTIFGVSGFTIRPARLHID